MADPQPQQPLDDRRLYVRAMRHWEDLREDHPLPAIESLDFATDPDFETHSLLLDLTMGRNRMTAMHIGDELAARSGLEPGMSGLPDRGGNILIDTILGHVPDSVANCAAVGFEAETRIDENRELMFRGVILPLSSDGDTADFLWAIASWKEREVLRDAARVRISDNVLQGVEDTGGILAVKPGPDRKRGPMEVRPPKDRRSAARAAPAPAPTPAATTAPKPAPKPATARTRPRDNPPAIAHPQTAADNALPATLRACLRAAQDTAVTAAAAQARSHEALYRALGAAHDYHLAKRHAAALGRWNFPVEARTVAADVFAPFFDATRLSEFTRVLRFAVRENIRRGQLAARLAEFDGGIKTLVAQERKRERATAQNEPLDPRLAYRLRKAVPDRHGAGAAAGLEGEFALALIHRTPGQRPDLALVDVEERVLRRALRRIPGQGARR